MSATSSWAGASCSHASRNTAALLTQPRSGATAAAVAAAWVATASSAASPMTGRMRAAAG